MTPPALKQKLEACGQSHLLRFHDELPPERAAALVTQLEGIDFEALAGLIGEHLRADQHPDLPSDLEPAPYYRSVAAGAVAEGGRGRPYDEASYCDVGETLVRAGKVAAFTVAGGQGTRLGWNGPKGTYPATPVTGKPLFRCFAEQILAAEKRYEVTIPWYIMTSPANDAETRAFFADNNFFGLLRRNIVMFPQGTVPSIEADTGRLLLADRDRVAENPDGHGGSILALRRSGAVELLRDRGIEQISYFQVDNPLVKIIDPVFLGLHATAPDSSGEMSSKVVVKTEPGEKVGVLARAGGRTMVVEYSDLSETLAAERDAAGRLRYDGGNLAIHAMSVSFVERLTADEHRFGLPFHRALKKVPYVDLKTGRRVEPETPNAIKLETFVFDALPLAEASIVLETDRVEEFGPIKNMQGADSPATSHQLQSERAARWLAAHGVQIPRDASGRVDARLEISPLTALDPAGLVAIDLPAAIAAGSEVAL